MQSFVHKRTTQTLSSEPKLLMNITNKENKAVNQQLGVSSQTPLFNFGRTTLSSAHCQAVAGI